MMIDGSVVAGLGPFDHTGTVAYGYPSSLMALVAWHVALGLVELVGHGVVVAAPLVSAPSASAVAV